MLRLSAPERDNAPVFLPLPGLAFTTPTPTDESATGAGAHVFINGLDAGLVTETPDAIVRLIARWNNRQGVMQQNGQHHPTTEPLYVYWDEASEIPVLSIQAEGHAIEVML